MNEINVHSIRKAEHPPQCRTSSTQAETSVDLKSNIQGIFSLTVPVGTQILSCFGTRTETLIVAGSCSS